MKAKGQSEKFSWEFWDNSDEICHDYMLVAKGVTYGSGKPAGEGILLWTFDGTYEEAIQKRDAWLEKF